MSESGSVFQKRARQQVRKATEQSLFGTDTLPTQTTLQPQHPLSPKQKAPNHV